MVEHRGDLSRPDVRAVHVEATNIRQDKSEDERSWSAYVSLRQSVDISGCMPVYVCHLKLDYLLRRIHPPLNMESSAKDTSSSQDNAGRRNKRSVSEIITDVYTPFDHRGKVVTPFDNENKRDQEFQESRYNTHPRLAGGCLCSSFNLRIIQS